MNFSHGGRGGDSSSKFWKVVRSLCSRQVSAPSTHDAVFPPNARLIFYSIEQANSFPSHNSAITRLPSDLVERGMRSLVDPYNQYIWIKCHPSV